MKRGDWLLPCFALVVCLGQAGVGSAAPEEAGEELQAMAPMEIGFSDLIVATFDKLRSERGLPPLSPDQRQELQGAMSSPLRWLLVTSALLTLVAIGSGLHGFANGHPGWAIANLVLVVPVPAYVMLHVGGDGGGLKVLTLAATLAPALLMARAIWQLQLVALQGLA